MRFGDINIMVLSRLHIAALENDAPRPLSPFFSFDHLICRYHDANRMSGTHWQFTLTFSRRADRRRAGMRSLAMICANIRETSSFHCFHHLLPP